jgi:hypothetical protein
MSGSAKADWRASAQKRWPLHKIEGDGPFVAMPRGEATVYLFSTILKRSTDRRAMKTRSLPHDGAFLRGSASSGKNLRTLSKCRAWG